MIVCEFGPRTGETSGRTIN